MKAARLICIFSLLCAFIAVSHSVEADQLKIVITQDQSGAAQNYRPLAEYLRNKGLEVSFVGAPNYSAAATMFASGEADAMFSGSGIAGVMFLKDLAIPLVRPIGKDGLSTYWAVVIAPKGSARFAGSAEYFRGKKVIFTALASAGEFYFHSLVHAASVNAVTLIAASHGAAIDALSRDSADIAIVKNRVWDKTKEKYPNLIEVGADKGENPDNTLIVSHKTGPQTVSKLSAALLAMKEDKSPQAEAVRTQLNIQGYIKTTKTDFGHTMELLKKAGVTKSFNFTFK
jgi:ABC-type phosphate/phosphonate transport system substrate-binding protein